MATGVFFHAHPDDEVLAIGGTMLLASRAGHRVVLVCATDGALGDSPGRDPAGDSDSPDLATLEPPAGDTRRA